MKKCGKCNKTKKDDEFSFRSKKKGKLNTWCKKCMKEYDKNRYSSMSKKDLEKKSANRAKCTNRNRVYVWSYLSKNCCVDCGEEDPIVLEFDHQNDKVYAIADMMHGGFGLNKIKKEIAKCEVRCANCHRRKTAKELGWYKDLINNEPITTGKEDTL